MDKDSVTVSFEFHRDFKNRPELVPLLLRNIVVMLMCEHSGDDELSKAYLKIILDLEYAFPEELIWS